MITPDGIHKVPFLSGNALRHKLIREPMSIHLVKTLGLVGKATIPMLNFLFNGGTLSSSTPSNNTNKIAEMQTLLPLIRLLGGALKNQIVGGSLIVKRGIMVCRENQENLRKQLPEGVSFKRLRSCEDYIGKYQYTRGDASKYRDQSIAAESGSDVDTNLMIYSGEQVNVGATFYHGFILQGVSDVEIGGLLLALDLWTEDGGIIGGSSRIGHGRLSTAIHMDSCYNKAELVEMYKQHVMENSEAARIWLEANVA
ncbi:MAG: hypothetical protein R8L53_10340 [Mariprofundales bacterium]